MFSPQGRLFELRALCHCILGTSAERNRDDNGDIFFFWKSLQNVRSIHIGKSKDYLLKYLLDGWVDLLFS